MHEYIFFSFQDIGVIQFDEDFYFDSRVNAIGMVSQNYAVRPGTGVSMLGLCFSFSFCIVKYVNEKNECSFRLYRRRAQ